MYYLLLQICVRIFVLLNIFNSFINKYFDIKAGLSNINMDRTTAKLLLNSLYGRLGMKPYQDNIEIVNSLRAEDILSKFIVKEQYNLTNNLEFIRYENKPIFGFEELYGKDEYINFMLDCDYKNISVNQSLPTAIAITAYARMYMFKIIKIILFYSWFYINCKWYNLLLLKWY